ncbi:MAG: hypothetical protein IPN09_11795 [Bacteroidetes bacterium]|nr:hypothetical protein [Bacteroidota bacterium]
MTLTSSSTSLFHVDAKSYIQVLCGQTLTLTQNIAGIIHGVMAQRIIALPKYKRTWLEIDNGSCTGRDSIDIIISTSGLS